MDVSSAPANQSLSGNPAATSGAAAPTEGQSPAKEPAAPAIKLRIGAKPAPPPGPAQPADLPDPFADLDDKQPPLVPLQTLAPFPFKKPGTPVPAKPLAPPSPVKFSTPPIPVPAAAVPAFPPPVSHAVPPTVASGVQGGGAVPPFPVARAATLPPIPAPGATVPGAPISLPEVRAAVRKKRPAGVFIVAVLILALLGAGGAYFYFSQDVSEPVVVERPVTPPAPVIEPAPVVEAPPVVVDVEPEVEAPESVPVIEVVETPPVVEPVAPPPPPPPPAASAAFVRFSEAMTVSGVFQGTPARALVNGRLARVGDEIEPSLRIKFVGVDAATKHLILEEGSGAQLRVKY